MVDYLRFAKACKDAKEVMTTKPQSTTEPPDRIWLLRNDDASIDDCWQMSTITGSDDIEYARVTRHYFCSCGAACTAEEYLLHLFELDHDRVINVKPRISSASTAPVMNTGGFQCSCCGRNMEIRINGEFCNECAGHQSALRRVLRQIVNDLPGKRDWLDPALEQEARELTGCAAAAATAAPVEQIELTEEESQLIIGAIPLQALPSAPVDQSDINNIVAAVDALRNQWERERKRRLELYQTTDLYYDGLVKAGELILEHLNQIRAQPDAKLELPSPEYWNRLERD